MTSAFLYAATRTPFGRLGGALAGVLPDDLAAIAIGHPLGASGARILGTLAHRLLENVT